MEFVAGIIVFNLTHNGHCIFGYDNIPYARRQTKKQVYFQKYGRCQRNPLPFGQECLQTAKLIREDKKGSLQLLFSGGIDSEIILRSFRQLEIPIDVVVIRFKNDLNIQDISWAVVTLEGLGIKYRFLDLDIRKFLENEAFDKAKISQSRAPFMHVLCWALDQLDGIPILGSGELELVRNETTKSYEHIENESRMGMLKYLNYNNRDGVPLFFQYTPELMLSWLQEPLIKGFVAYSSEANSRARKTEIFHNYFDMLPRRKYDGYEKIIEEVEEYKKALTAIIPLDSTIRRSYSNLSSNLRL